MKKYAIKLNKEGQFWYLESENGQIYRKIEDNEKIQLTDGRYVEYHSDGTKTVLPKVNYQNVIDNIWQFENPKDKGLKDGKYFPFTNSTGGKDVANGIDLKKKIQTSRHGLTPALLKNRLIL